MLFALVAVPHVILIKNLVFLELIETVFDRDGSLLVSLTIITTTINPLAFLHARQVLDEILAEGVGPDDVDDEVMLAFIVSVETNVVIDANLVKHVEDCHLVRVGKRAVASAG